MKTTTDQPELFELYPRVKELGLRVYKRPCAHIKWEHLDAKVKEAGLDREKFGDLFGIQTCYARGPYPWDVEAVLERMMSGQLTGTQKYWD